MNTAVIILCLFQVVTIGILAIAIERICFLEKLVSDIQDKQIDSLKSELLNQIRK